MMMMMMIMMRHLDAATGIAFRRTKRFVDVRIYARFLKLCNRYR